MSVYKLIYKSYFMDENINYNAPDFNLNMLKGKEYQFINPKYLENGICEEYGIPVFIESALDDTEWFLNDMKHKMKNHFNSYNDGDPIEFGGITIR